MDARRLLRFSGIHVVRDAETSSCNELPSNGSKVNPDGFSGC